MSPEERAACNCFEYGGRSMCPLHSPAATGERDRPKATCCCDLLTARLLVCPTHPTSDIPTATKESHE